MKKLFLGVGKVFVVLASVALIFFLSFYFEADGTNWIGKIKGLDMFLLVNNKQLLVYEIAAAIMQVVSIYAVFRLLLFLFRKKTALIFSGLFLFIAIIPNLFFAEKYLFLAILFRVLVFVVLYKAFSFLGRNKTSIAELDINEEQIIEECREYEN